MNLPDKIKHHLSTSAQVKARFGGVSDMSLWRWLRDDKLGFPQPIRIQGRRFWYDHELGEFEARQRAAAERPKAA